jgi:hypothetical protein
MWDSACNALHLFEAVVADSKYVMFTCRLQVTQGWFTVLLTSSMLHTIRMPHNICSSCSKIRRQVAPNKVQPCILLLAW